MIRKTWSQKEINYITENYGVFTANEMAVYLGRTPMSVKHKLDRLNIKSPNRWSDDELQFIKDNYKTMTYSDIAKALGRTKSAVDCKVNNLGLVKSKYQYNHDFFKDIQTEDQAYWCGFIMADGNVTEYANNSCELSIKLQARDGDHLKKFNKAINGNVPVKYFDTDCKILNYRTMYRQAQIRLYSERILHDLANYGVIPNKSLIKQFPDNIPEHLIFHYIRGYFDGNGTIACSNDKYIKCLFTTGSYDFACGLKKKLNEYGILSGKITQSKNNQCFRIQISGIINVDRFLHFLYSNSSICLDRKFNKKLQLYKTTNMEQRLLRQSEKIAHSRNESSEKENGKAEMLIRMEG